MGVAILMALLGDRPAGTLAGPCLIGGGKDRK
jgi:hypothetical protein